MTDPNATAKKIIANVERAIIGKRQQIVLALAAWFSEGHVLLEDVPGVAKTMLARALSRSVGCTFKRIQCTPDLLPSDVTGASVFNQKTTEFEFRPGPIFAQIVLADEINRATPRTQAALLEAMGESRVTVDGVTRELSPPFLVVATQNPVDHEGTFPLPEAQLDRFLVRFSLGYPSLEEELHMLDRLQRRHPVEKIEPNRGTAWSSSITAPYAVDPMVFRQESEREQTTETWIIDKAKGVARMEAEVARPRPIEVPLRPMLGCVGTAPANKEAIATSTPDRFGGNMDYPGMNAGVKLMLPVNEPGALLFIGDGHARQGHAEVVGTGLETSMDVEFTVDLVKSKTIGWPRLETDDYIVVLGSARPLMQALQHATTELQRWLMEDYGFNERGSSLLMGHAMEYEIANVVDPHFTVAAKMRKSYLPAR